ncbi:MAG: ATP-binding protein, partial [bacterium]
MSKRPSYEELLDELNRLKVENNQLKLASGDSITYIKDVLENLPFVAWIKEKNGIYIYVNYLYSSKIYKRIDDIIGKTDFDLYPREIAEVHKKNDDKILSSKITEIFEYKSKDKWLKISISPIIHNGILIGTFGYERDITIESEALTNLMKERDFLHALMNNIPYTIYFKDTKSRFTRINKSQAKLIGIENPDQAIGKTDFDFFSEDHAKAAYKDEKEIILTGKPLIEKVEKLTNAENERRWLSATKYPIRDIEGNIIGIVGMSRDITEERLAGQKLKEAKERAEESDRLKTAFLANMSHEIRTPMNGIIGFANLLKNADLGEEERAEFLEHIDKCGESLLTLIDDIIDISKIEAGQIKIRETECKVNLILDELVTYFNNLKNREEKNEIDIRLVKGKEDNNLTFFTDPNRFRQIMINLIGNALKFTRKGYIEFGYTLVNDSFLEFFVKDTGIGIPEDKLEIIFERFGQVVDTSRINPKGTGLGLAISINLVRLLHGKMWVDSKMGEGSTFFFTLPFKQTMGDTQDTGLPIMTWANKTILVAEDDESSWYFLKETLEKTKARLLWAKNGQQAVDVCRTNPNINLVLMDMRMPVMDGYMATRQIREFNQ